MILQRIIMNNLSLKILLYHPNCYNSTCHPPSALLQSKHNKMEKDSYGRIADELIEEIMYENTTRISNTEVSYSHSEPQ
jgi:hypothetical protein